MMGTETRKRKGRLVRISDDLHALMLHHKERFGLPISVQTDRALAAYLVHQAQTQAPTKRRTDA